MRKIEKVAAGAVAWLLLWLTISTVFGFVFAGVDELLDNGEPEWVDMNEEIRGELAIAYITCQQANDTANCLRDAGIPDVSQEGFIEWLDGEHSPGFYTSYRYLFVGYFLLATLMYCIFTLIVLGLWVMSVDF